MLDSVRWQTSNGHMKKHDLDQELARLQSEHTPEAIAKRLGERKHNYLKDFIYGAIDGTVTTFAIVAGVAGAGLSAGIIVVLGLANLFGDGFSMAVSNYLGTRAEEQLRDRHRLSELEQIKRFPAGEREEVRQILASKGFDGGDLDRAVDTITADTDRWVDTMLTDELGLSLVGPNPLRAAWSTFAAFLIVGALPLLPFFAMLLFPGLITADNAFALSTVLTGGAFFVVGAAKSRFVGEPWWRSGLITLLMGGAAAGIAYSIGLSLRGVVNGAGL
jgi:VIT1/CCC1 family predicted Fe2+/Mn2+ transporter